AAFGAVPGLVHTAKRCFGFVNGRVIHSDLAGLEQVAGPSCDGAALREYVRGQTEAERVGALDDLVELPERRDRRYRPARFLGHDLRALRNVSHDRGALKESAPAQSLGTGHNCSALRRGVAHEVVHEVEASL